MAFLVVPRRGTAGRKIIPFARLHIFPDKSCNFEYLNRVSPDPIPRRSGAFGIMLRVVVCRDEIRRLRERARDRALFQRSCLWAVWTARARTGSVRTARARTGSVRTARARDPARYRG